MTSPHIEAIARDMCVITITGPDELIEVWDDATKAMIEAPCWTFYIPMATVAFTMSGEIFAKVVEPIGERPCDCGICVRCINTHSDAALFWDIAMSQVDAIRALIQKEVG